MEKIISINSKSKELREDSLDKVIPEKAEKWLMEAISENKLISFDYNGRKYQSFINEWKKEIHNGVAKDGRRQYTVKYKSPDNVLLTTEIYFDTQLGLIEWCSYFKNASDSRSPVISNILSADISFVMKNPELMTANGNNNNDITDFEPSYVKLINGKTVTRSCYDGRSSQGSLPYYDICSDNLGVIGAIGWTGQWTACFSNYGGTVNIKSGMTQTCISLYEKESMRTPSTVLLLFEGERDFGHNIFRKSYMQYYVPCDEKGKRINKLPLFMAVHCPMGEKGVLEQIEKCEAEKIDYEVLWADAGWSGKMQNVVTGQLDWYNHTGDWYVNPDLYPEEGFKNVSDRLVSYGKKLMLWFEPERAMRNTNVYKEHPEYFLASDPQCRFELLDLSSDKVTDYIADTIATFLKENGIHLYRQDFNLNPLEKWQQADAMQGENRVGITEIKYITNLYRYIDTLIVRNPGLIMDNCASGGRRIDIEMAKRSVVFWRTDYTVDVPPSYADGVRYIGSKLNMWFPMSGCGAGTDGLRNEYQYRSMQSSAAQIQPIYENAALYEKMNKQYYRCRELMNDKYYILKQGVLEKYNSEIAVYEWYDDSKGQGFIQVFTPKNSKDTSATIMPKGLEENAVYKITVEETGETYTVLGEDFMSGCVSFVDMPKESTYLLYIEKQ